VPPSAAMKSYLWVADPRQVTFLCLSKEKSPKERTPRSRRPLPALLAEGGARLTAHPCAAGACTLPARTLSGLFRLRLRCSAAATGSGAAAPH
jgi:hypothetical protein